VPTQKLSLYSITPVWVLVALVGGLILFLSPPDQHLLWLSITLAISAILTFCIQLGLDRKEGLVNRVMASLGGSLVILAVATAASLLVAAA
jgi:hypothetical protein